MWKRLCLSLLFALIALPLLANARALMELKDLSTLAHLAAVEAQHGHSHSQADQRDAKHSHKHQHSPNEPVHEHNHSESALLGGDAVRMAPRLSELLFRLAPDHHSYPLFDQTLPPNFFLKLTLRPPIA
jgi:ABC-type Zn2+ transport system substrate-binding protein/surface adhesin